MKLIQCNEITAELYGDVHVFYAPLDVPLEQIEINLKAVAKTAHVRSTERKSIQPNKLSTRLLPGL